MTKTKRKRAKRLKSNKKMTGERKKILIMVAASKMVLPFRTDLIKKFQAGGYDVGVVAFDDDCSEKIKELGVEFFCTFDDNRSTNPLKIFSLKNKYVKIINAFKPDVVFTFMLKPNIFGTRAAKKAGVKKVFSMVEGAGDAFIYNTLKWKVIRVVVSAMYKKSFKISNKVFFLNEDDKAEFIRRKLVKGDKCEIVHGVGVNIDKFAYKPVENKATFLMVARMLETKGIYEYAAAARMVKQKYPDAVFGYLGGEGTVKVEDIKEYIDDGSLNYYGETADVRPYYEKSTVCVLPSYREGFGLVNAEGGAVGRAVITCNTNGTKDTVKDGYNGFLIPIKNAKAIAEKMIYFIENHEKAVEMGINARKFAEDNFDQKVINQKIFDIVDGQN
ncbi:MAG: glycosyltransferase family 4 protein [Clostridia bacterium]|nr:glycosyltransferase family 4 protein [Clostridia bacterium]